MKLHFYKLLFALMFFNATNSFAMILVTQSKASSEQFKILKSNILKLGVPKSLIHFSYEKSCQVNQRYDMVICLKKNGELMFPVYKRYLISKKYKPFLN